MPAKQLKTQDETILKAKVKHMSGDRVDGYYYVQIADTNLIVCKNGHPDFPHMYKDSSSNPKQRAQRLADTINKQLCITKTTATKIKEKMYFGIVRYDKENTLVITYEKDWDKHHFQSDTIDSHTRNVLATFGFTEVEDATFTYPQHLSRDSILWRAEMLGFIYNADFEAFVIDCISDK